MVLLSLKEIPKKCTFWTQKNHKFRANNEPMVFVQFIQFLIFEKHSLNKQIMAFLSRKISSPINTRAAIYVCLYQHIRGQGKQGML